MIIVRLADGLGNQMFQYAFARVLGIRMNRKVRFYKGWFSKATCQGGRTPRDYELHIFNANIIFTKQESLWHFLFKGETFFQRGIHKLLNFTVFLRYIVSTGQGIEFEDSFLSRIKGFVLLSGCFQTESYFRKYRQQLLSDFSLKSKLSANSLSLKKKIEIVNSVSIHVRRGDKLTENIFSICGGEYFKEAINIIKSKVNNPHFFIFSEEFDWIKEKGLMSGLPTTYVQGNTLERSYEDMILMSYCQHNIIANSTFSWWGAWLNKNDDKIVIAPKRWRSDEQESIRHSKDILPPEWIQI